MNRPVLSVDQVREIARRYDGTSETIDALMRDLGIRERRHVRAAAIREGYRTRRQRKEWKPADDTYLGQNYGRIPVEELCAQLGCSERALLMRKKRLGISTRDFEDLTVGDLEALTKIDHRLWHRFIEDGWLRAWEQPRRNAPPAVRVSIEALHALLISHPEVLDYRAVSTAVRGVLELGRLPDPPRYKRVTCRSDSFRDRDVDHCAPGPYGAGSRETKLTSYRYSLASCADIGGVDFWAGTYETDLTCPRCGCKVSRFSEKGLFCDEDPGDSEALNAIAGKLGLRFANGRFVDENSHPVSDEDLLRYVFNTKRNAGDAVRAFRKLLAAGLKVAKSHPVPCEAVLDNILSYELLAGDQVQAWSEFLEYGNLGVYWPPGIGKMYFLGMVLTRLAGRHVVFANTTTIIEQWIAHLTAYAPRVSVRKRHKPSFHEVVVFDRAGAERCAIELFAYQTGYDFADRRYVVAGYDEAHYLPGNNAHRVAMLPCRYRVGLTATPFREDGRADLIQTLTGRSIGDDWAPFLASGAVARIPVRVVVVDDLTQKFDAILEVVDHQRKTLVFADLIADCQRIAADLGAPLVTSALTTGRLTTILDHRVVVASRVADCGIDVPDLEEVVEFGFHHGSRAQSLQRLGRLLHAERPLSHTVLMTREEFTRHYKRLTAMEQKGFAISLSVYEPANPPRLARPVAIADNPWLALFGKTDIAVPRRSHVTTAGGSGADVPDVVDLIEPTNCASAYGLCE